MSCPPRVAGAAMTWVDFTAIAVLLVSGALAFLRGFVREILGLAGWIGALAAATWGLPFLRPHLVNLMHESAWVNPVGFVAIFLVSLIILLLIARVIGNAVNDSPLGGVDRTLGLAFGLLRGAALVIIAYIGAGLVVPVNQWPAPVQQARLLWPTYMGARWAAQQLPSNYRPRVYPPSGGRDATAQALLQPVPEGSATGPAPTPSPGSATPPPAPRE